ncbi:RNA-binding S4 domain-containing protein [Peptostreptococcus porci]|uniref:RNA-binding S4 domain-containing protein n=1 Tax=Peptostreptococcus porci TaxID=2652282 RepID=A0A6N7XE19_9FIRM|nr:RNA-binding S4 domain-containing protein [Peptostreptococcus porci]MDD7182237.1 RNA-binding S4 domain-containing protein [Peptostreptococcus porci]MDY2793655.1 RNA-binding S4 domain-containing protein [Peptostreptococcus porci]MDY4128750.1 RNA-binding S4 domain-containing protein [Peptostreptococcus porci]MDY4561573.1 RNA-binding S4 domain-containing protein [Peptostreptococcus porci]MDY5436281.1 RNA-binding S4 domain-containing protein [Peptostreptococcus porci]
MKNIKIKTDFIKLDQFLKLADVVMSGGEAKVLILSEDVIVNGEICTQRGRKIKKGDIVKVNDMSFLVE